MGSFKISGGRRLSGEVSVQGAKNSILPILSAAILSPGISTIHNCPRLCDVDAAICILRHVGCRVDFRDDTITIDSREVRNCSIPDAMMRKMRSSVIFMGAILARCGSVSLFAPGGCELGSRPIDLHISALRKLGARVDEEGGAIFCAAEKMRGADITLSFPSVGATENIMLAATACKGVTRIINAAREPEIADLESFLRAMGANVYGAGSSVITIEGPSRLHDAEHTIIADRIVASTYMSALAICGGRIRLNNARSEHLEAVLPIFQASCKIDAGENFIEMESAGRLSAVRTVRTMPYPGFPTDAQPPVMAALTKACGTSTFVENIFDGRYRHVSELCRFGADIRVEGNVAIIYGKRTLFGTVCEAHDLRGGAALMVAAMGAEGESEIFGTEHIDRGYEAPEKGFALLGADIKRAGG